MTSEAGAAAPPPPPHLCVGCEKKYDIIMTLL